MSHTYQSPVLLARFTGMSKNAKGHDILLDCRLYAIGILDYVVQCRADIHAHEKPILAKSDRNRIITALVSIAIGEGLLDDNEDIAVLDANVYYPESRVK